MKNLYLIKTNKRSKLLDWHDNRLYLDDTRYLRNYLNIYITSNEEIKEGYVFNTFNNTVYKIVPDNSSRELLENPINLPLCSINKEHYLKIILTTDPDLIKDGVQDIDDEFLKWFVKNPSCEEVETKLEFIQTPDNIKDGFYYKIIIPKGEVKPHSFCETPDENCCLSGALLAAGKLALASRLITTANAKNISQRIEQLETELDAYDKVILSLSNDKILKK